MNWIDITICAVALIAILGQSLMPRFRHFIMAGGASIGLLLVWLKTGSIMETLQAVPLDVMLILLGLTLFGDFILKSNVFAVLIKIIAKVCKGKPTRIYLLFSLIMFFISALLNNYQAVLLLTPALIGILSQLEDVKKIYVSILFGTMIVLSNLGGAALPISDFPALYMFSQGVISFASYVPSATPLVLVATLFVVVMGVLAIKFNAQGKVSESSLISVAFTTSLYRTIHVVKPKLFWSVVIFSGMMIFWIMGVNPTVVTVIGLTLLAIVIEKGTFLEQKIREIDASIFVFYFSLFAVIATIQSTPFLNMIAEWVSSQKDNPLMLIIIFSTTTTLVTAIVSAGPSTVVLLPVALQIAGSYPPNMVIACFALSICAGSSIFTFSATAGPLVQSLTEKYKLTVEGKPLSFGFKEYFVPGLMGGLIIYMVNLIYIFINLKSTIL
jgi:Na+/H+ antiporter NhaD/arsenite permease-like protein